MLETNENTSPNKGIVHFIKSRRFWKPALGITIGGVAGLLYYYFEGCTTGGCVITGNPYLSILLGSLLGLFFVKSPCLNGRC